MTQVKTQLADFTRYQQQQRQAIAKSSNESQGTRDGAESQYTSNIKQRILELATQQKELLKCFQCHKKLLEKIQALKQEAKSVTKHILPAVEEHHKSCNKQQDISDKSAHPPLSNPFEVTTSNKSTTGSNKQVGKQSVDSRLTPLMSSLKPAKSLLDSSTASSSCFPCHSLRWSITASTSSYKLYFCISLSQYSKCYTNSKFHDPISHISTKGSKCCVNHRAALSSGEQTSVCLTTRIDSKHYIISYDTGSPTTASHTSRGTI